ncbi:FHA domain-containing protein [Verrucomicrobia bacterium S94]|nr:FHA domain-containing protein [Verrucomicrobia bacterium S94]
MSHLIIEQGKEVGREVKVPAAGIKFGRSPANDLVLDDDAVMLFHGRFFFKSDGTLWVTDFGAGEKTTVSGEPVDEHQLKVGDLVEVGHTAFRIINTGRAEEVPVSAVAGKNEEECADVPEAPENEIDLGFKRHKKTARKKGREKEPPQKGALLTSRLLQVSVILLFLIVLMIVGPSLFELSRTDVPAVEQKESLTFSYERVMGTPRNIFRYHVELDDKGLFSVRIDDLKTNRHQLESKEISDTVIEQLSIGIEAAGFFDVDSDYAGTVENQYDLYKLAVLRNSRFHHITILNWTPPVAIKRTTQLIEDFAVSELGISFTWMKEPEELMQLAENAFEVGEARYNERDIRYGNLASAIVHLKETMLYLETIEPKPALYHRAAGLLEAAQTEQNVRYEDYLFRSDRAIRLRNWDEAAKYLRILNELIQDRSDPRYEKVSAKLLNVEQHLR